MNWTTFKALPAALLVLLAAAGVGWAQVPTISLDVPGPADWNIATNWDIDDVPGSAFGDPFPQEVVGIAGDRIAFLDSPAMFPVDGMILGVNTLGTGTLEIRTGGELNVTPGGGDLLGTILVGQGDATGVLDVQGTLDASDLELGGAAGSQLRVLGGGTINVVSNANLRRNTLVSGPDFSFLLGGDLALDGALTYQITSPNGGTMLVPDGDANLDGTLIIDMAGHTPEVGQSWTVINARSLTGTFADVQVPATPLGLGINVFEDAATGDVTVGVDSRMVLRVDRSGGDAVIENIFSDVEFDAYNISSPGGRLLPNSWNSLDERGLDGGNWHEANPTVNNLSELNLLGSATLGAASELSLGPLFNTAPIALGVPVPEDVTFEYTTPEGRRLVGTVLFEGPVRPVTLELVVDRATGALSLRNQTGLTADLDGYLISSPGGRLDSAGWNSLQDQMTDGGNWFEAAASGNNLAELNLLGMTTLTGISSVPLGNGWDISVTQFGEVPLEDLALEFTTADGQRISGVVTYEGQIQNNLFLFVNPVTGAATIQNRSGFEVEVDAYNISSESSSLSPDDWNSLDDQMVDGGNWSEANPTQMNLSELNLEGMSTFSPETALHLGLPYLGFDGTQDLAFRFHVIGLGQFDGVVVYGDIVLGDTNGDNAVNIDDLNNVRNNFGAAGPGPPLGDTNGDGVVNIDDLNNVRNNFGATLATAAAVPEPAGFVLAWLGMLIAGMTRRRGERVT